MNSHFPRARKRFGQHFLNDPAIITRIINSIHPRSTDHMIEIGPGPDVLTEHLVPAVDALTLIEIDRDLAAKLDKRYADKKHVTLLNEDVLKVDWDQFDHSQPWRIVGNLPYNISTPLIFTLLNANLPISDMTFLLQQEVVNRLCAKPGSKQYGRLSVMTQYHCQARRLFSVPPEAFTPAPKVVSAVVKLIPWASPPAVAKNHEHFTNLVSQAFSQRRKTIQNSLKGCSTKEQLIAADINPGDRPETISVQHYIALSNLCL